MKKYLIISLVALISAANLSCYAADKQKIVTIELVSLKDKQDATVMENAFHSYVNQKMECINKKPVTLSSCAHLTEFYKAKEVYKSTIKQHPDWLDNSLHWKITTPRDHHMNLNNFQIVFK